MISENKIFDLIELNDLLEVLGFHVIKQGSHRILYHISTGTLWKVDDEDFKRKHISFTIDTLLKRISKKIQYDKKIYKNTLRYKPSSKIALVITTLCNMSCDYCYASQGNYELLEENMSKDIAKCAINKLESSFGRTHWIQFFGGEPLLNFDIIQFIVKYLRRRRAKVKFTINTNGSVMTDDMARFLGENFAEIYVSIDGPQEIHDVHRKFRDNRGSWEIVTRNIKKLRRYLSKDTKLLAEVTFTKEHLEKNYSITELWNYLINNMGFHDAYIVWASYPPDNDFEEFQWLTLEKLISEFIEICFNKSIETSILNEWKMMLSKKYFCHLQPCTAGLTTLTITPNGDVYPCFQLIKEDLKMGNVLDVSFPDDRFKFVCKTLLLNSKLTSSPCCNCWLRNLCKYCLGKRYMFSGNIYESNPHECKLRKKMIEQVVKFIAEQ
jgi:uncharacterized protein